MIRPKMWKGATVRGKKQRERVPTGADGSYMFQRCRVVSCHVRTSYLKSIISNEQSTGKDIVAIILSR